MKPIASGWISRISACLISLTLMGCAGSRSDIDPVVAAQLSGAALPDIPDMPGDLRQACPRPQPTVGADSKVLNQRYAVALTACNRRRARAVAWSDGIRRDYGTAARSEAAAAP